MDFDLESTMKDLSRFGYNFSKVEVLWSKGHKPLPPLHPLLIKGRNLYRLNTLRSHLQQFLFGVDAAVKVVLDVALSFSSYVLSLTPRLRSALVTFVMSKIKEIAERDGNPLMADGKPVVVNEQQVKFLYTTLKLLRYSRMTVVVLVSLPPPPPSPIYILYGILGSFGGKHSEVFNCKRIQERCGHVVYIT